MSQIRVEVDVHYYEIANNMKYSNTRLVGMLEAIYHTISLKRIEQASGHLTKNAKRNLSEYFKEISDILDPDKN